MDARTKRERSVCLRSRFEDAVWGAPEEAQIKVENIGGPVLHIYPEHDAMWPSELAAQKALSLRYNNCTDAIQVWDKFDTGEIV